MGKVKVFGAWGSPYSKRVEFALQLKGIEYEFVEEDLQNKSEELIKCNPVHKKIPVLVHDGKSMAESLVILEYIDQVWKANPLLPSDPYERAQARFWAKFIDDKLMPQLMIALMSKGGEEREKEIKELEGLLKILDDEIKGKKFFGGNTIGLLDIVASIVAFWMPCLLQVFANEEILTKEKYPWICSWSDEFLECNVIKQNLPNKERVQEYLRAQLEYLKAKATT